MMKIIYLPVILILAYFPMAGFAQEKKPEIQNLENKDSISAWSFSAEGDQYVFPTEADILTLIASANKNKLHLEARYNYENRNTASLWGGMNFSFGKNVKFVLTPIAGVVFGQMNGLAPGLLADISYKSLYFNSQTEWVFDFKSSEESFVYTFLQLGVGVTENLSLGITAQRSRLILSNTDLQRGFFAEYTFWKMTAGLSYFDPFSSDYYFMAVLAVDF
jgi:hypothetical protein